MTIFKRVEIQFMNIMRPIVFVEMVLALIVVLTGAYMWTFAYFGLSGGMWAIIGLTLLGSGAAALIGGIVAFSLLTIANNTRVTSEDSIVRSDKKLLIGMIVVMIILPLIISGVIEKKVSSGVDEALGEFAPAAIEEPLSAVEAAPPADAAAAPEADATAPAAYAPADTAAMETDAEPEDYPMAK